MREKVQGRYKNYHKKLVFFCTVSKKRIVFINKLFWYRYFLSLQKIINEK